MLYMAVENEGGGNNTDGYLGIMLHIQLFIYSSASHNPPKIMELNLSKFKHFWKPWKEDLNNKSKSVNELF